MPNYFTCDEIALLYKVKTITVWDWVRKKKLPAIKIGRDYRIRQEDLDAFEKSRETIKS
jgi:excisionase family DNA binding protein